MAPLTSTPYPPRMRSLSKSCHLRCVALAVGLACACVVEAQVSRAFSSYWGGGSADDFFGCAVAADGTTYYIGTTESSDFPTTSAAYQRYPQGNPDAVLVAVDPSGVVNWSTHLGTAGTESSQWGIALSPDERFVYVSFSTTGASLPLVGPTSYQPTAAGGADVVLARFRRNGIPVWATYFGGSGDDRPARLTATPSGEVVLAGTTFSSNLPMRAGADATYGGNGDGFYARFSPDGALLQSSYVGGPGADEAYEAAVSPSGTQYIVGTSNNGSWLGTPVRAHAGGQDLFVIAHRGPTPVYATYIGGSDSEHGAELPGLTVDATDNVYVSGRSLSSNYPVLNAAQPARGGGWDGVLTSLSPTGQIRWSTYVGGSQADEITAIDLVRGLVYVGGSTRSNDLPSITGSTAFQPSAGGGRDGFSMSFRENGTLAYGSYYGSNGDDEVHDISVSRAGYVTFAGHTAGTNFPIENAAQATTGGGRDAQLVLLRLPPLEALVVSVSAAGSCDDANGTVVVRLPAGGRGTPPYDVSFNNGETYARIGRQASAAGDITLSNVRWGSYQMVVRDAVGRLSRAGSAIVDGCVYSLCTAQGNSRFAIPLAKGADSYQWSTTLGSIASGQSTRTMFLNTAGVPYGTTGRVCIQPIGPGCSVPTICVDVVVGCATEICDNGIDDDGDGLIDCGDEDCPPPTMVTRVERG